MKIDEIKKRRAYLFTLLVLSFSLLLWGSLAIFRFKVPNLDQNETVSAFPMILYILNGFIPSILGVVLYFRYDPYKAKERLRSLIPTKSMLKPVCVIIVLFLLVFLLQTTLYHLLVSSYDYRVIPAQIIQLIPLIFLGPLSEEIGWRGFLQDQFPKNRPMRTSLIIGSIWALWHYPLFFMLGTTQQKNDMSPITFTIQVILISYLMTLFYNRSKGSLFLSVLIHYMYTVILTFYILGTSYTIFGDLLSILSVSIMTFAYVIYSRHKKPSIEHVL